MSPFEHLPLPAEVVLAGAALASVSASPETPAWLTKEVLVAFLGVLTAAVVAWRIVNKSQDALAKHALTAMNSAHQASVTSLQTQITSLYVRLGETEEHWREALRRWNECEEHRIEQHAAIGELRREISQARGEG